MLGGDHHVLPDQEIPVRRDIFLQGRERERLTGILMDDQGCCSWPYVSWFILFVLEGLQDKCEGVEGQGYGPKDLASMRQSSQEIDRNWN